MSHIPTVRVVGLWSVLAATQGVVVVGYIYIYRLENLRIMRFVLIMVRDLARDSHINTIESANSCGVC